MLSSCVLDSYALPSFRRRPPSAYYVSRRLGIYQPVDGSGTPTGTLMATATYNTIVSKQMLALSVVLALLQARFIFSALLTGIQCHSPPWLTELTEKHVNA